MAQYNIKDDGVLDVIVKLIFYIVSTLSGGGFAGLNDPTGYAGGNFMFLVGPPKPDRP